MKNPLVKNFVIIFLGIVLSFFIVLNIEWISHFLIQMPKEIDIKNTEEMKKYMHNAPPIAFVWPLIAWFAGAFSLTFFINSLAVGKKTTSLLIGSAIFFASVILNFFEFYHPLWMIVIGIIGTLIFLYLGIKISGRYSKKI